MSASEFVAPLYRILYGDALSKATMCGYSLDSKPHTSPPRTFDVAHLPLLVFQLVDAGYTVSKEREPRGQTILVAVTGQYVDYHRDEMERRILERRGEQP